jgi:hypothetical protein
MTQSGLITTFVKPDEYHGKMQLGFIWNEYMRDQLAKVPIGSYVNIKPSDKAKFGWLMEWRENKSWSPRQVEKIEQSIQDSKDDFKRYQAKTDRLMDIAGDIPF